MKQNFGIIISGEEDVIKELLSEIYYLQEQGKLFIVKYRRDYVKKLKIEYEHV